MGWTHWLRTMVVISHRAITILTMVGNTRETTKIDKNNVITHLKHEHLPFLPMPATKSTSMRSQNNDTDICSTPTKSTPGPEQVSRENGRPPELGDPLESQVDYRSPLTCVDIEVMPENEVETCSTCDVKVKSKSSSVKQTEGIRNYVNRQGSPTCTDN